MTGALICAAALGLTNGVYDICWTLLWCREGRPDSPSASRGPCSPCLSWPWRRPSGWLADHMDRRVLVIGGLGLSAALCASYPFIHNVPALVLLGGSEAVGFAAAMPAVQSLLTQGSAPHQVGRIQGLFATSQTACTAIAAGGAGAAFALAAWLPFVTVAALVLVGLVVTTLVWRSVRGDVASRADHPPVSHHPSSTGADPDPVGVVGLAH